MNIYEYVHVYGGDVEPDERDCDIEQHEWMLNHELGEYCECRDCQADEVEACTVSAEGLAARFGGEVVAEFAHPGGFGLCG